MAKKKKKKKKSHNIPIQYHPSGEQEEGIQKSF